MSTDVSSCGSIRLNLYLTSLDDEEKLQRLLVKEKKQFSLIKNDIDILLSMKRAVPAISKVEPSVDEFNTTEEGKSLSVKSPNVESYNVKRT